MNTSTPQTSKSLHKKLQACSTRSHRLQNLCGCLQIDAILIIGGADSKHSKGTQQALNYLFQGWYSWTPENSRRLPEWLEDIVLLITPSDIRIWASGGNLLLLFEAFGPLQDALRIFGTVEGEEDCDDVLEDCKIGAFVQMLKGIKSVGIPDSGVEMWPLVQAYGIEGIGKRGFFSQNFQVSDITKELQDHVYIFWDERLVYQLLTENITYLVRHWKEMLLTIDTCPIMDRQTLGLKTITEPLDLYLEHNFIRCGRNPNQINDVWKSSFFIGTCTPKKADNILDIDSAATLGDAQSAAIFVCELVDCKTGIGAGRSYFLGNPGLEAQLQPDNWEHRHALGHKAKQLKADGKKLMLVYQAMVDVEKELVENIKAQQYFGPSHDQKMIEKGSKIFMEAIESLGGTHQPKSISLTLKFIHLASGSSQMHSFVLKMCVPEIRDWENGDDRVIGELVLANTYLLFYPPNSKGELSLLNITSEIPVMRIFAAHEPEISIINQTQKSIQTALESCTQSGITGHRPVTVESQAQLPVDLMIEGKNLGVFARLQEEPCLLFTGAGLMPVLQGSASFFSGGLVVCDSSSMPLIFEFNIGLQRVSLCKMKHRNFDGEPLSDIGTVVVFEWKKSCCSMAPLSLVGSGTHIGLPLASLSPSGRRYLVHEIIPLWKKTCSQREIKFDSSESGQNMFPKDLYFQQWNALQNHLGHYQKYPIDVEDSFIECVLEGMHRMQVDKIRDIDSRSTLQPESIKIQLGDQENVSSAKPQAPLLTVITGPPGSRQIEIAEEMMGAHAGDIAPWIPAVYLATHLSDTSRIDSKQLNKVLLNALDQAALSDSHAMNILLVMPCMFSARNIAKAIRSTACLQKNLCVFASMIFSIHLDIWLSSRWDGLENIVSHVDPDFAGHVVLIGARAKEIKSILALYHPNGRIFVCEDSPFHTPIPISHYMPLHPDAKPFPVSMDSQWSTVLHPTSWWHRAEAIHVSFTGLINTATLRAEIENYEFLGNTNGNPAPYPFTDPDLLSEIEPMVIAITGLLQQPDGLGANKICILERAAGSSNEWKPLHQLHKHNFDCQWQNEGCEGQIVFWGLNLHGQLDTIKTLVLNSKVSPPGPLQLRQLQSVTEAERFAVHNAHKKDPLPPGWIYAQGRYFNEFGGCHTNHPQFEDFLKHHLEEENSRLEDSHAALVKEMCSLPKFRMDVTLYKQ